MTAQADTQPPRGTERVRRTDLQPLVTMSNYPPRRVFISPVYRSPMTAISNSAVTPVSPSYVAVRQYYRHNGVFTAVQHTPVFRSGNIPFPEYYPRRHSSISSSSGLAGRLERVAVSSPHGPGPSPQTIRQRSRFRSIAEDSRNQLLAGLEGVQLAKIESVIERRHSDTMPPVTAEETTQESLERLLHWGYAYLGNFGTADAIVNAVPRRLRALVDAGPALAGASKGVISDAEETPTPVSVQATEQTNTAIEDEVTIRARVTPHSRHRKPFLIQRRFNIVELRSSIQAAKTIPTPPTDDLAGDKSTEEESSEETGSHTRSKSTPPAHTIASAPLKNSKFTLPHVSGAANRRTMPIHIEYALRHLPVLAALMLSGHVHKGDSIDLPLPHPEAWAESVAWVYTGRGEISNAVVENIRYLGGSAGLGDKVLVSVERGLPIHGVNVILANQPHVTASWLQALCRMQTD